MLKFTTDKQTDKMTDKQTGQKQNALDHSTQGHKELIQPCLYEGRLPITYYGSKDTMKLQEISENHMKIKTNQIDIKGYISEMFMALQTLNKIG